jgi:hypothetical protein
MKPFEHRISLLHHLGEIFREVSSLKPIKHLVKYQELQNSLQKINDQNPWFTKEFILLSISTWGETLTPEAISKWHMKYLIPDKTPKSRSVTVIMAGNIPLVGFHDFVCTILSGNIFLGKLSSRDSILFPLIRNWIIEIDPEWDGYIQLTHNIPENPEIIIATGSNNTSRMVRQQYSTERKIVRHNRSSIGLVNGNETKEDLEQLSSDILSYFGLGCRNVSLLFIPEGFDILKLADIISEIEIELPPPYMNNLKYQRAKAGVNNETMLDGGKLLFKQSRDLNSPLAMIHYDYYRDPKEIEVFLRSHQNQIQCMVGNPEHWDDVVPFGQSQKPELDDYADGIDTMEFLINL